MRLPSLRHLRTFQVAGRHLSFKRAGEDLSITASAVSHQIRNLELFLGMRLFRRLTRSLAFTEAGKQYFNYLDTMFSRLESETQQLLTDYDRSIVRLCVPPFFAEEAILPNLASFEEHSKQTDILVSTQSSATTELSSDADVAIVLGDPQQRGQETHRLFERKVVVACSNRYLTKHPIRSYAELSGQEMLVHDKNPGGWKEWSEAVGAKEPVPRKLIRSDSMSAIVKAAQQDLGVALVSWPLGRSSFDRKSLVRVFDEEVGTNNYFYVTVRSKDKRRPEVVKLLDWIIAKFEYYA
jgi:LysR family glycine cleavage system transcriptional activator